MANQKSVKQKPLGRQITSKVSKPGKKPNYFLWLGMILALTLFCFFPILSDQKEFTNWDDPGYVTEQPLVRSLSSENIGKIFAPSSIVMFNYHPVTVLSLAIDYQRGFDVDTNTINIAPFATTNLILHLLNTALVFFFLYHLSKRRLWVGIISALLFGIHPMHVESVAWISGRKDLLYCFFFLLSCITYLKYIDNDKKSMLFLSFVCFVLSCLSKAMAAPLPLVLVLLDFLYRGRTSLKTIIEKIPFFAISLLIGYYAIVAQQGVIGEHGLLTLWQRISYAGYSFIMYWVKLIAPVGLSAFYPYPFHIVDSSSFIYLVSPVIALGMLLLPIVFYFKRKGGAFSREMLWGMGFYFAMIFMVLQLVSVGQVIIAERYSYVSYIGPLFMISVFANRYFTDENYRKIAIGILTAVSLILGVITYQHVQVWRNSKTLWTDVLEKKGNSKEEVSKFKTPYKNLADYYTGIQEYDSAFVYYSTLTASGTQDAEVWSNLGNIHALKNDMPFALSAYDKSLQLKPSDYETLMKRGVVYGKLDKSNEAIKDFEQVVVLKPDFEDAYVMKLRTLLKTGQYVAVASEGKEFVKKFPANADLWFLKGAALVNLNRYEEGISDFQQAIKINPKAAALYYYNVASAYAKLGQNALALKNAQQAQQLGFPVAPEFMQQISK